eukprot:TRINITY_DN2014_c0_g1_i2.p1 TRINITY_DN2014_c0_g1~~TRINITY_DN2014_c0_g1_i2.p1  ORF type:complete len:695 (+),score=192.50 TRINITY_DN2014_c0_g1_i2:195-2279(+)
MEADEEVKHGQLLKKEKKKWAPAYFSLRGRMLFFYKSLKDYQQKKKKAAGSIALAGAAVRSDGLPPDDVGRYLQITERDGTLHFLSGSAGDLADWTDVLQGAASGAGATRESVAIIEDLRKNTYEIPPADLEFTELELGAGASGVVHTGLWLKSTEVAIKALKNLPEFIDRKEMTQFYGEIELLSKLRHANIVQMFGFCKKDNLICLVTEFVKGGNLADCLEDKTRPLNIVLQVEIALSITKAMVYLHNQSVIHRDLKPANILVENWDEGRVKVCDFGLSRARKRRELDVGDDESLGSPQYAAPELSSDNHTNKVDVFSFAIILWQIYHRSVPWEDEIRFGSAYAKRYEIGLRPPITTACAFKDLIVKCWDSNPNNRPPFVETYQSLQALAKEHYAASWPISSLASLSQSHSSSSMSPPFPHNSPLASPALVRTRTPPAGSMVAPVFATLGVVGLRRSSLATATSIEDEIDFVFNGSDRVIWALFSQKLSTVFGAPLSDLEGLRYLVERDGAVLRSLWDRVRGWFAPLSPIDNEYITQAAPNHYALNGGYQLSTVLKLVSPRWFRGFLDSNEAADLLRTSPEGSFLFRFSGQPGSYALSVAYHGTVGHWRITCEKSHGGQPIFGIDSRKYASLADVLDAHRPGADPLIIKQPRPGMSNTVFLMFPCERPLPRDKALDDHYMNVEAGIVELALHA